MASLVARNYVLDNKVYPLGNVYLEQHIVAHKFVYHLIYLVVKPFELLQLVGVAFEDILMHLLGVVILTNQLCGLHELLL